MNQTATFNALEEIVRSRHSVRKYRQGVTIPEQELTDILELGASAPSSWNLQHWRFLVIASQAGKERLLPLSFGQSQVVEASVVIIVLGDLQADLTCREMYDAYLASGAISKQVRDNMVNQVSAAYKTEGVAEREAVLNASLAAMQLMLAAKAKGYDSVPMGGFDKPGVMKEFAIPERYTPVMLLPIGQA